jgi:hypothetical protein|nr:MAG TPA: tail length tape measure protein [Caudoviricetes sp.]
MAEVNNPIKTSDLIQNDGTIDKLIADLEKLRDKYVKSMDEIRKKANALDQTLQKLSGSTEQQKQTAQQSAAEADRMSRAYKEMKKEAAALESEIIALRRQKAELTSATQAETKAMQAEAKSVKELSDLVESVAGARGDLLDQMVREQAVLTRIREERKELTKAEKEGRISSEDAITKRARLLNTETQYKISLQQTRSQLNANTKQLLAANGSYEESAQLLERMRMSYRSLGESMQKSPLGVEMLRNIELLDAKVKKADASMGNFQRNVGNYPMFNNLQFQVQQIAREMPSLTQSLSQFFLAISNNAPMLGDAFVRARQEYKNLRAEGKEGIPVWKQLLKSVVSWQTALVVGITLMTGYGKEIGNFFKELVTGSNKMRSYIQLQRDINKAVQDSADTLGKQYATYRKLQAEWKKVPNDLKTQEEWIIKNKTAFKDLGIAVTDTNDAQNAFVDNSDKVVESMMQQARAAAARKLAEEEFTKAIKKEQEARLQDKEADDIRKNNRTTFLGRLGALGNPYAAGSGMSQQEAAVELAAEAAESAAASLRKEAEAFNAIGLSFFAIQREAENEAAKLLKDSNLSAYDDENAAEKRRKEEERKRKVEEAAARRKQTQADKEARAAARQEKYSFDATKKAEQLQIDALQEGYAKRRATIEFNAKWEEAELERRYKKIEGFTEGDADLWKDYAYAVLANEKSKNDQLIQLDTQYAIESRQLTQETLQNRLATLQEGSDEYIRLQREMLENARQIELLENKTRPAEQRQDETVINAKYRFQATQQGFQSGMTGIDTAFSVQNSEIEALKATEREKTVLRLQAEKERWEKVLALMNQYGGVVSDADVAIVKNAITATNNEIEKAKQPRDLWDAMGINLDDDKKQAISESVSFALEQMTAILDAEIEMAQQAVDAANERVTAAQSALDAEMQAKANGLAYSQTEAEKRLEMEKQNQAKAIAEQKKAQKQKAQIETMQQISSLVTASAAIWGALVLPWLAIPAIAIMWATFGAAKIKASQLAKSSGTEQYGDGTYEFIDGGSHQSGNDVPLGINPRTGKERRVEGGEMFAVVNKAGVRKYRSELPTIINSLNRGEFDRTYIRQAFAQQPAEVIVNASSDNRKIAADIAAIRRLSERQVYTDSKGRTVIRYKKHTKILN